MKNRTTVQITPNYLKEMKLKRDTIIKNPERCFVALDHTYEAQWEATLYIAKELALRYPDTFTMTSRKYGFTLNNHLLKEEVRFDYKVNKEPLNDIGKHVQEDLILMFQREGQLFLDAGQLCFPSNWSLAFNKGMAFMDIHRPVPGFQEGQLDRRIERFLLHLCPGDPFERSNWSLMAGETLNTHLETFPEWGKKRYSVTEDTVGNYVHVRVEVQKLHRLPKTYTILFTIHTHLLSLKELSKDLNKANQLYTILLSLPKPIEEYKGITPYKSHVMNYLEGVL